MTDSQVSHFTEVALEAVEAEAGEDAVGGSGLKMRKPVWVGAGLRSQKPTLDFVAVVRQALESNDSPMLNAFCRVAPSDRFNLLAILAAGVFLRAAT